MAERTGRDSPPTRRVLAVLDFLAAHPTERFGLSELARRVGISKPTCLGIAATLCESGHLVRDDRTKGYRLGPALIPLGRAARASLRADPAGGDVLAALSRACAAPASISAVVGDRVTVLDVAAGPGGAARVEVGDSYPFAAPAGLMYVLWDTAGGFERWRSAAAGDGRRDGDRLAAVVAGCRADGYLVELLTPAGERLHRVMAGAAGEVPPQLRAALAEVVAGVQDRVLLPGETDGAGRPVSAISAPVFDGAGAQAMVVTLYVGGELTPDGIAERGAAVAAAADRITRRIGGTVPGRARGAHGAGRPGWTSSS